MFDQGFCPSNMITTSSGVLPDSTASFANLLPVTAKPVHAATGAFVEWTQTARPRATALQRSRGRPAKHTGGIVATTRLVCHFAFGITLGQFWLLPTIVGPSAHFCFHTSRSKK
jgi:hypothetical protein